MKKKKYIVPGINVLSFETEGSVMVETSTRITDNTGNTDLEEPGNGGSTDDSSQFGSKLNDNLWEWDEEDY